MHPALLTVAAHHFGPQVDRFMADWWRTYRSRPKIIDVAEWMNARHRIPHDDACAIIDQLIRNRRLTAHPDGRPAFRDEPLYDWLAEEVIC